MGINYAHLHSLTVREMIGLIRDGFYLRPYGAAAVAISGFSTLTDAASLSHFTKFPKPSRRKRSRRLWKSGALE